MIQVMENNFDLEEEFNEFLGTAGGNGEEMDAEFREQLRRAFYAGCGRTLLILNEHAANMEEEQGVSAIDHLFRQVHSFFLKGFSSNEFSSNDFTDNAYEGEGSKE